MNWFSQKKSERFGVDHEFIRTRSVVFIARSWVNPAGGDPVCGRAGAGGECCHFDGGGLVPAAWDRGAGHSARVRPPDRIRRRPPDGRRARLRRPGSNQPQAHAQHARDLDRHVTHQSRQGRHRAGTPGRPRTDGPASQGASRAGVAGGRRAGLDRRRRHAQICQQIQAFSGVSASE